MRFAIVFTGYMIALSIDAPLLYDHLGFFMIAVILIAMFYLDITSIPLERIEDLKKVVAEYKKTGETQNNDKNDSPPGPIKPI